MSHRFMPRGIAAGHLAVLARLACAPPVSGVQYVAAGVLTITERLQDLGEVVFAYAVDPVHLPWHEDRLADFPLPRTSSD